MIALLGDTHLPRGSRRLPDACLRLVAEAELVLHVGDFTALSILEDLREIAPVVAVRGNVDEWPLQEALPERLVQEHEGLRFGLVHDPGPAAGRYERLRGWFPDCALVAYGHTHAPEVVEHAGTWIVNPGSPTERRRAATHSMALVRDGTPLLVEL